MDSSLITSIFLLLMTLLPNPASSIGCSISKCGDSNNPIVRFPFRFTDLEQQPVTCGSPGFNVSCDDSSQNTLIDLPTIGNLTIKNIDYAAQEIWVNDPNNCLPQKLLNFNLTSSPFFNVYDQLFTFFNCSTTIKIDHTKTYTIGPINCLSKSNYFIYATPSNGTVSLLHETCLVIAPMVKVPVQWPPSKHENSTSFDLNEDLRLSWFMPECQPCELNGQMCGLGTNSSGSQIKICTNISTSNGSKSGKLPSTTVIAVILIICSPSIICIIVSLWIWIRACYAERSAHSQQNGSVVSQRSNNQAQLMELGLEEFNVEFARQVVLLGLRTENGPEFQPAIVLSEFDKAGLGPTKDGESSSCAICMGEYQERDRIGSLPTCGHYFHAECINKWLLPSPRILKRTCPICRASVG
ncbi:hypothetical protein vseg_011967 [Gypsophila vaccaria]